VATSAQRLVILRHCLHQSKIAKKDNAGAWRKIWVRLASRTVYGSKWTLGENCFFYDFFLSFPSSTFEAFCTQSYQEGLTVE